MCSPLSGLARPRSAKTRRLSSFDRSGSNADRTFVPSGERAVLADVSGAGTIQHTWSTLACRDPRYRRPLILRTFWDGQEHPSVESPLGDLFGQGWGKFCHSVSLPAGTAGGRAMGRYFPIPFSNGAPIEIENPCDVLADSFSYATDCEHHESLGEDVGRFHAWWNRELTDPGDAGERAPLGPPRSGRTRPRRRGKLRRHLSLPREEDMFLVDGEPWPGSAHGTGTEDSFTMSRCPKEPSRHPPFGFGRVNNDIGSTWRTPWRLRSRFGLRSSTLTLELSSAVYRRRTPPSTKPKAAQTLGQRTATPERTPPWKPVK